ncbi:MAG TPA: hypothetical protein VME24_04390 [Alphaproteobacteria bacterium]|nr:hypothetical protein [Alphaproteobacteria bacterium]
MATEEQFTEGARVLARVKIWRDDYFAKIKHSNEPSGVMDDGRRYSDPDDANRTVRAQADQL